MLLIDLEAYGSQDRNDLVRSRLRAALRQLVASAFYKAGIESTQYAAQSTGDGIIVTMEPAIEKPRILGQAIDALAFTLRGYNCLAVPAERLRTRVVVHAADLLIDSDGPFGDQVNFAFRLLDAGRLRTLLRLAEGPMLVCVSDIIYRQVILQRHGELDPSHFEPIWLGSKGIEELGWVRVPGEPGLVARSGLLAVDEGTARGGSLLPAGE